MSVDGFRLALRREPLERIDGGAFRFVAPGSALNEVEKICEDSDSLISIIQGKRHLLFETGLDAADLPPSRGGIPRLPQRHPAQQPHLRAGGDEGDDEQP